MRKMRNKILILLNNNKDDHNMVDALLMDCMRFEVTMIMCWSFEEAAQYLQTYKSYENKTQTILEGKQHGQNHFDQAVDVLGSIRRVSKNDAKRLLYNYGSIKDIIMCEDYDEFINIEGIGQSKIECITTCFRGKFDFKTTK